MILFPSRSQQDAVMILLQRDDIYQMFSAAIVDIMFMDVIIMYMSMKDIFNC